MAIKTKGLTVTFGKYKGEKWTRVPIWYLKTLVNARTKDSNIALAEINRRGIEIIEEKVEISAHAIDRASLFWDKFPKKRKLGLHEWLKQMTLKAMKQHGKKEEMTYKGIRFVFGKGKICPTLKTVMVVKKKAITNFDKTKKYAGKANP